MERRRVDRVPTDADAQVTVLDDSGRCYAGRILDFSGRGMRLILPVRLALDLPLRIACCDEIYIGEIAHCSPSATGFQVGIEVHDCLHHTPDLDRLRNCLSSPRRYRDTIPSLFDE